MRTRIDQYIERRVRWPWLARAMQSNFSLFALLGAVHTLLVAGLLSIFVDWLKWPTFTTTLVIMSILYVLKWFLYVRIELMVDRFWKYNLLNALMVVAQAGVIWLLVDVFHFFASGSSLVITAVIFLFRFLVFKKARMFAAR